MSKTITIIGSGISSLTTAILTLKEGHKVTILEQHSVPGGFLHCFKRFGVRFETGAHYIGALDEGLPFHKLLNYLGVYHEDDYIALDPENTDEYNIENGIYSYCKGYEKNISKITEMFPEFGDEISTYFGEIKNSAVSFPTYYFKEESDQSVMLKYLKMSLHDFLISLKIPKELYDLLIAPCILHGVSPKDLSFGIHSILIDSILVSAHGFRHGGQLLAKRLVDRIEELGGEVLLRKEVVDLEVTDDGKDIKAINCKDGSRYESDLFISGIHPKHVFDMVGKENLKKSFSSRLGKMKESSAFIGAYIILKDSLGINPLRNYYFAPKGVPPYFHAEEIRREDQFFFMTSPQRDIQRRDKFPITIHASCAGETFSGWDLETLKRNDKEYNALKEELFVPIFDQLDKRFPGFKDNIEKVCYSSPLTNIRYNPTPNGSAYGIYHSFENTGARAIGPRSHFHNMYLTGQNTLFPGLLGASVSGLRTAGHIVGIKRILRELEQL
ncbi:hypothetical protein A9Q84_01230 [Halobacteriovorax marinus]|uniref:Amine oxidase domain-containing protein n=1 Tax=Halobacteriovorax marinus TaxID=97084 RepID=A0A1Y5FHJ3_9BACT|nr:hypothetical protein A9Q84_01230 [Halobacteriovorax marinus]